MPDSIRTPRRDTKRKPTAPRTDDWTRRIIEGRHAYDLGVAAMLSIDVRSLDYPIHEYRHGPLGTSIMGGQVYRGTNDPALQERYIFDDFSIGSTPPGRPGT